MHRYNIAYIDLDEDEIMHWKYIKKEKVGGKWRYYYDVGYAGYIDGNTGKRPSNVVGFSKTEDLLGKDEQMRANRATAVYEAANKASTNREYSSNSERQAEMNRVAELGQKAIEANKAYMKTPLGKLEQAKTTIEKAKKKVANWLRKLANKLSA
jgi:hypothetical protein